MIKKKGYAQIITVLVVLGLLIGGAYAFVKYVYGADQNRSRDLDRSVMYYWLDGRVDVDQPFATGDMDITSLGILDIEKAKPLTKSLSIFSGEAHGVLKIWSTPASFSSAWEAQGSIPQKGDHRVIGYVEVEYEVGRFESSSYAEFDDLPLGKEGISTAYVHVKLITDAGYQEAYHIWEVDVLSSYKSDHIILED